MECRSDEMSLASDIFFLKGLGKRWDPNWIYDRSSVLKLPLLPYLTVLGHCFKEKRRNVRYMELVLWPFVAEF